MIKKIYRLKEKEMKKVLAKGKPFFSYMIVLNKAPNIQGYNRFGIIISQKSIENSVTRNFFRRLFYDIVECYLESNDLHHNQVGDLSQKFDYVCVVKKQTILDRRVSSTKEEFEKNLHFLFSKNLKIGKKYLI